MCSGMTGDAIHILKEDWKKSKLQGKREFKLGYVEHEVPLKHPRENCLASIWKSGPINGESSVETYTLTYVK